MRRAEKWTIGDVLDFEFLLAADETLEDEKLRLRDRKIGEAIGADGLSAADQKTRRALLRQWLEAQRSETATILPGEHFLAGWHTLLTFTVIVGLVLGASLSAGLLNYHGTEPVNVAWFFAWTVGTQILVLFTALIFWLLRKCAGSVRNFGPLQWLLSGVWWAVGIGLRRLPGEKRERLLASFAKVRRSREMYGSLAVWPVLVLTQLFGVWVNIGILVTLLAHVVMSDIAFAWQATGWNNPERMFAIVKTVAAPWSWFAENAHPSLAEVAASRFRFSAGMSPLAIAATASWWPFLAYSVAFYGLFVRTLLFVFSLLKLRAMLSGISFDQHACNALLRRMTGPLVAADSSGRTLKIPEGTEPSATHSSKGAECIVFVASELSLDAAEVREYVRTNYGWVVAEILPARIDYPSGNTDLLAQLARSSTKVASVIVIVPARRSPIKAIALFLEKVVEAAGAYREVLLTLRGESSAQEMEHWRNFNAIHGLQIGLETWRRHE